MRDSLLGRSVLVRVTSSLAIGLLFVGCDWGGAPRFPAVDRCRVHRHPKCHPGYRSRHRYGGRHSHSSDRAGAEWDLRRCASCLAEADRRQRARCRDQSRCAGVCRCHARSDRHGRRRGCDVRRTGLAARVRVADRASRGHSRPRCGCTSSTRGTRRPQSRLCTDRPRTWGVCRSRGFPVTLDRAARMCRSSEAARGESLRQRTNRDERGAPANTRVAD